MEGQRIGRIAFVFRNTFVPRTEYYRYDIVEFKGNLYHCKNPYKSTYQTIETDIDGNVIGKSVSSWELFLRGNSLTGIIAGDGIEVIRKSDGIWEINQKISVDSEDDSPITVRKEVTQSGKVLYHLDCDIKGGEVSSRGTLVKSVDGDITYLDWKVGNTSNISITQDTEKKWNFSVKNVTVEKEQGSPITINTTTTSTGTKYTIGCIQQEIPLAATWERWWVKYPWDISLVPPTPTLTYIGPMHYSSNGLNLVGMDFRSGGCKPCVADNGSIVAITEPEDGIIPVINWNMQYDLGINSSYGEELEGLTFDTYTSSTSPVTQNKLYVKGTSSEIASTAGFCLSGEGGYTKEWRDSGYGAERTEWKNNHFGQIVAIISITPNENFSNATWHFHTNITYYTIEWDNSTGKMTIDNELKKYKKNGDELERTDEDFYCGQNIYYALLGQDPDIRSGAHLSGIRKLDDDEVAQYITDSVSIESEATGSDNTITFSITVNGSNVTSTVNKSDLPDSVVIDEDSLTYTCKVATNDLQDELLYTFEQDCILDIDEDSPYKHIFKTNQKISLPYYSGCTFIPYTQTT